SPGMPSRRPSMNSLVLASADHVDGCRKHSGSPPPFGDPRTSLMGPGRATAPGSGGLPGDELPDLGLERPGPADLGERGDGMLEVVHCLVLPSGGVELVRKVIL